MSLFSALFFCIFVSLHQYIWALIMCVGFIFDALDGYVARHSKRVTLFGGILDSSTDRMADFFMLSSFAYAGLISWNLIAPLILITFLISYIRSRSETAFPGKHFAEGLMQRTERIVLLLVGFILFLLFPNLTLFSHSLLGIVLLILLVLNSITVVQRLLLLPRS